jgi:hypothetical protein
MSGPIGSRWHKSARETQAVIEGMLNRSEAADTFPSTANIELMVAPGAYSKHRMDKKRLRLQDQTKGSPHFTEGGTQWHRNAK